MNFKYVVLSLNSKVKKRYFVNGRSFLVQCLGKDLHNLCLCSKPTVGELVISVLSSVLVFSLRTPLLTEWESNKGRHTRLTLLACRKLSLRSTGPL